MTSLALFPPELPVLRETSNGGCQQVSLLRPS
ncbi:rCG52877 [Rattus norvegicus]|uniref:RCG52877 n=1 Tax=Rattus norvegicus TaxID=10116 RepID=A6IRG1_RAT|nr:rCG52877 [Rattus norvegicus]